MSASAKPGWYLDHVAPYADAIERLAVRNGLDPDLLSAIAMQESKGDRWAARHEAHWPDSQILFPREHAERLGISSITESMLQRTSWGVWQLMGAVARQHGYEGQITQLTQPELCLEFACRHLKWLRTRCQEEADLIASYNGGWGALKKTPGGMYPNQLYVDSVAGLLHELRKLD
jgi:hypothetical protein